VRHLKNFPKLKRLSLYGSKVTDAGVAELRQTYGKQASISK
jgi:hypothetical protein